MGRRGPKPKWVEDGNREEIIGLILRSDGRYTAHENRNKTLGRDRDEAIRRFSAWQSSQRGETVAIYEPAPASPHVLDEWRDQSEQHPNAEARAYYKQAHKNGQAGGHTKIQDAAFWATVGKLIRENPKLVARKTGIEELAYLHDIKPQAPSIALEALGNLYQDKRALTDEWKRKARLFWGEFRSVVKVKTAREITAKHIEQYHDAILDELESGKSPTYVKQRFGMVKTMFNYAMIRGRDQKDMRRILDFCKMLVPPKAVGKKPTPISPQHFSALLAACDAKWKAVYLLSLNAALYPSEVAAVKIDDIDLDAGTLRMDRNKTGVHRIAVLWSRTVEAIREYQAEHPHQSEYLFTSEVGQPYNSNHMGRNFRRRRTEAELPESVEFSHIRDGAETAAINGGADLTQACLLAGHRTGIPDHYVKRAPTMVADACAAIERHYFGQ